VRLATGGRHVSGKNAGDLTAMWRAADARRVGGALAARWRRVGGALAARFRRVTGNPRSARSVHAAEVQLGVVFDPDPAVLRVLGEDLLELVLQLRAARVAGGGDVRRRERAAEQPVEV
jgi:hypothetical protein